MQPITLDYLTTKAASFGWRLLLRLFLLGPFTGALVGFAQTSAAVLCWVLHGEPDFYFRGWSGVRADFVLLTIGGGMVGVAYGIALWLFEGFSRRRIRLFVVIPVVVTVAFVIAAVIAESEFRQQEIGWVLAPQLLGIVFGVLVSALTSRRAP